LTDLPLYGTSDATFKAAGGEAGIRSLVDAFYRIMGDEPAFRPIYDMHGLASAGTELARTELIRDKLARFLCGWMGGENLYNERYGAISIPGVHAHLKVTEIERDLWLACMTRALDEQPYSPELKSYLIRQLSFPAERVRQVSEKNQTR